MIPVPLDLQLHKVYGGHAVGLWMQHHASSGTRQAVAAAREAMTGELDWQL